MYKIISFLLVCLLLISLSSCVPVKKGNEEKARDEETVYVDTSKDLSDVTAPDSDAVTTENEATTNNQYLVNNYVEAIQYVKDFVGEKDSTSGFKKVFAFDEMVNDNGTMYYKIRVSTYDEENDITAVAGFYLVDRNGQVYDYNW